jgi:HTH-type transcriptional regulator, cell division transcriptional repressor
MRRQRAKSQQAPQPSRNIIGERMRQARRESQPRVTQADLSARVAAYGVVINRASIGKIEQGTRIVTDYEVRAIAAALAVAVGWLVAEEEVHDEGEIVRKLRPQRRIN